MIERGSQIKVTDGIAKGRTGIVSKIRTPENEPPLGLKLTEPVFVVDLDPQGCGHIANLSESQIEAV